VVDAVVVVVAHRGEGAAGAVAPRRATGHRVVAQVTHRDAGLSMRAALA
jgi:hypothetical protein